VVILVVLKSAAAAAAAAPNKQSINFERTWQYWEPLKCFFRSPFNSPFTSTTRKKKKKMQIKTFNKLRYVSYMSRFQDGEFCDQEIK
jgi:hypothetical protein